MKSRFTQFLMCIISFLIVFAIGIIGLILFQNLFGTEDDNIIEEIGEYNNGTLLIEDSTNNTTTENNVIREQIEIPNQTSNNQNGNTEEFTIENNRYFYKQINKYSKYIYDAFDQNKEKMKNGKYQVELGNKFSDILQKENGQEMLKEYYQSAIEAYSYDNPDIFYLDPIKMYLNVETTTRGSSKTYNVYINSGEEENYFIDEFDSEEQVEQAIAKLENIRNKFIRQKIGDDYKDIKRVHDYLVDNIEYDKSLEAENSYNIYGALINNTCVCEGYAKAFKYLLDGLGIEATLVIGEGTNSLGESENHAWNYVKLEDTYYAVDVTWDDPVVIGGSPTPQMRYKYFLKGEGDMQEDHFPSGVFTEGSMEFQYPELSEEAYE